MDMSIPSTKPYLLRALWEWCCDHGFTPYLVVQVNQYARVPREHVRDGQIVLNISPDATGHLRMGDEFIDFQARFNGVAREISVPVEQVAAIYARENGIGMAFDLGSVATEKAAGQEMTDTEGEAEQDGKSPVRSPSAPTRPALKRVK